MAADLVIFELVLVFQPIGGKLQSITLCRDNVRRTRQTWAETGP